MYAILASVRGAFRNLTTPRRVLWPRSANLPSSNVVGLGLVLLLAGVAALFTDASTPLPQGLLILYPLIAVVGALAGIRTGIGAAALAFLLVVQSLPTDFSMDLLVAGSLLIVGATSGALSDGLVRAIKAEEETRLASNSFAAALHHRLTLAEEEIERAHHRGEGPLENHVDFDP